MAGPLVRWKAEWGGAGGGADGSTKYRLSADGPDGPGVITQVEETWEFRPKEGAEQINFFKALDYCKARRPPGANRLLPAVFMPPVKLAAGPGPSLFTRRADTVTRRRRMYGCTGTTRTNSKGTGV